MFMFCFSVVVVVVIVVVKGTKGGSSRGKVKNQGEMEGK